MRTAFETFFSWPNGGVWSNFVASAVLGVPAVYAILRKMAKQHREHMETLHRHHKEVLEHLDVTQQASPEERSL